jgi:hypothetical protein
VRLHKAEFLFLLPLEVSYGSGEGCILNRPGIIKSHPRNKKSAGAHAWRLVPFWKKQLDLEELSGVCLAPKETRFLELAAEEEVTGGIALPTWWRIMSQ